MNILTIILTLYDPHDATVTLTGTHDAFESFSAPVFCDFIRNYFACRLRPDNHFRLKYDNAMFKLDNLKTPANVSIFTSAFK